MAGRSCALYRRPSTMPCRCQNTFHNKAQKAHKAHEAQEYSNRQDDSNWLRTGVPLARHGEIANKHRDFSRSCVSLTIFGGLVSARPSSECARPNSAARSLCARGSANRSKAKLRSSRSLPLPTTCNYRATGRDLFAPQSQTAERSEATTHTGGAAANSFRQARMGAQHPEV